MGKLVDGKWQASVEQTRVDDGGAFVRGRTKFREWISTDPFAAEPGRYHLWAGIYCDDFASSRK